MGIGENIKQLRKENNLTQKELADRLDVTYQAVSRWENDDVEPSFDTLKKMTSIFNCTFDELFNVGREQADDQSPEAVIEPVVVEKVVVKESKPVIGVCERCNKPIFEGDELNRITITERKGLRLGSTVQTKIVLCKDCNKKHLEEKAREEKQAIAQKEAECLHKRKRSFIWPSLIALVLIIVGAVTCKNYLYVSIFFFVIGALSFPFAACLFLDNNFLEDMWFHVASFGVVKMPGVIMEFSINGFIIGIAIKIILAIIGFLIGLAAVIAATALGMAISLFVYPFALAKNIKEANGYKS